ncbi:unnamed protein product [Rotaria sp. Silwood1]|nr:unnamed protein product [Rotaria sp. Silwood1]CAF3446737.1 unnamed protein product [Rotaria sp. Silwood1]CAF3452931.1 unnamed protein product [Rotaria sp. Silwood1]
MSSEFTTTSVENKPQKMTVDEYSKLIAKWQEAYYAWNTSYVTYYNMMMLNSLVQQVPLLTGVNLLTTTTETIHSVPPPTPVDPLADIRNARLKVASIWRRFLAEAIDCILLHAFKILIIFILANYFHLFDASRLTLNYMISSLIYDETLSFPLELICVELAYLIGSIAFESFCLTRYGATPGKRLFHLRVLKCDHLQIQENGDVTIEPGTILDSAAALTRSSFKTLMATFLFPAVIVALLTSQNRQTSYDMAANTVVVEFQRREQWDNTNNFNKMTNNNGRVDIQLSTVDEHYNESDDSELDEPQQPIPNVEEQIDTSQLQWLPWMWYYTKRSAKKGYEICDVAGEKLAWFFGITKPKYYAEFQEYERMDEEEREAWRQAFQDVEQTSHVLDSIR